MFLPCSLQQPLSSCSLPNPLCHSLCFSVLPGLGFRSSFSKSPSAAGNTKHLLPCRTLSWPSRSPVTQEQAKQIPIWYPSVLQDWFYYKMKLSIHNTPMSFITCCTKLWFGQMHDSTALVLIERTRSLCFVCLCKHLCHSCVLYIAYFHMHLTMWCLPNSAVVQFKALRAQPKW